MASKRSKFSVNLFYSYSHQDAKYRDDMERSLTLLANLGLRQWSDKSILPGENISDKITNKMEESDIFAFLISPNFIASSPCRKEWEHAVALANKNRPVVLVPIIVSDCAWQDLENMSEVKALPNDAKPILSFRDRNLAWKQIYDGLKLVIHKLRNTFVVKTDFRKEMEQTEFISQDYASLDELFVFPQLSSHPDNSADFSTSITFDDAQAIIDEKRAVIYGERLSGKTALCRHLFLKLISREAPVLFLDLETISKNRSTQALIENEYYNQFYGDFLVWINKHNRVVILDNLTDDSKITEHVLAITELFAKVIITVDAQTFQAYFRDDRRFAQFTQIQLCPLTHNKQETLIRKRLLLSARNSGPPGDHGLISDGYVDLVENRVNSVVINNRVLPRYPFYVLAILQTYEGYMPGDLSITSYGHCYYVLIIAHLEKSGISKTDDEIGVCLNFCEAFAFEIHQSNSFKVGVDEVEFSSFVGRYRDKYIIHDSTLNRLFNPSYGIIRKTRGSFRYPWMYYYFLGQYLAHNLKENHDVIDQIVERSYATYNSLVLIFAIHHTNEYQLIERILARTAQALSDLKPAKLDPSETKTFEFMVDQIPEDILSGESIASEREKERETRDKLELEDRDLSDQLTETEADATDVVNDMYRITKNNEILGQILRNKYGSIERQKLAEIVRTIVDGGLRLVRILIGEKEIHELAQFLHKRHPSFDVDKLKYILGWLSFFWADYNIERVVDALNKPEIGEVVSDVLGVDDVPAYDILRYFWSLETVREFSSSNRKSLQEILKKHRPDPFIERMISLRTQRYLNTHRIDIRIEQGVCSDLKLKYRSRLKNVDTVSEPEFDKNKSGKGGNRGSSHMTNRRK